MYSAKTKRKGKTKVWVKAAANHKNPYAPAKGDVNPKDAFAGDKLPIHLVPDSLEIWSCFGFLEGAVKYGQFNWRIKPVLFSVYLTALKRHVKLLASGQWVDPKTKVPHISSILANAGIIGDATLEGTLIDDRPPRARGLERMMCDTETNRAAIRFLLDLFKDYNPIQYSMLNTIHSRGRNREHVKSDNEPKRARRRASKVSK